MEMTETPETTLLDWLIVALALLPLVLLITGYRG